MSTPKHKHPPSPEFGDEGDTDLFVNCSECGKRRHDEIVFENIESDIFGADVLTFRCLKCGIFRKSNVFG